jgi:hypothetical protein
MSKRLIRVKPDQISGNLVALQRQPVNAVFSNGNTIFGRLISVETNLLFLKDTRDHTHQIPLSDLYELVYDDNTGIVPPSRHPTL